MLGTMASSDAGSRSLIDSQFVAPKAHDLDVEIVVDELYFFTQRDKRIRTIQQAAGESSPASKSSRAPCRDRSARATRLN
jgi:hypothetical protein